MKIFIKKIFLYGLILILLIGIFFFINKALIFKNSFLSIDSQFNKIIIGASRTESAINDKILIGSYNTSESADALFFSKIKLRLFKNYNSNIDTVFLSLDNRTLRSSNNFYKSHHIKKRIPKYCYYFTGYEWKQIINIDFKSSIISLSFVPKYTKKLIQGILNESKENPKDLEIGRYLKLTNIVKESIIKDFIKNDSLKNYTLSIIEVENLNIIVEYCILNNIELIFINPPIHPAMYNSLEYQEGKIIFDDFLKTTFPYHTYLDFSNEFLPNSCYADLIHLNEKGAKIFSKRLNKILKITSAKKMVLASP